MRILMKIRGIESLFLCFCIILSVSQIAYENEVYADSDTEIYNKIELLNKFKNIKMSESFMGDEIQNDDVADKYKLNKEDLDTGISNADIGIDKTEDENKDEYKNKYNEFEGVYNSHKEKIAEENNISSYASTKVAISYYYDTCIPTFTSLTDIKFITSDDLDGITGYFYSYNLDDHIAYINYLEKSGWLEVGETVADDYSMASIYLKKGSLTISVVAYFKRSMTVIMFPSPKIPTRVTLNASGRNMIVGNMYQLTSYVEPSNSNKVTWSSSNSNVARVTQDGIVYAQSSGRATITAKTSNGKKATCSIYVKPLSLNYYSDTRNMVPTFTCITGKSLISESIIGGAFTCKYYCDMYSFVDYESYLEYDGWKKLLEEWSDDKSVMTEVYVKNGNVVMLMIDFKNEYVYVGYKKYLSNIYFFDGTYSYNGKQKDIKITGMLPTGAEVAYENNTATDAGTYDATATITCEGYHDLSLSAKLKINPALIIVTADDKKMFKNTAIPTLTYKSSNLFGNDTFSGELSVSANGNQCGIFEITQGTLSAGKNYTINFSSGKLYVTDKTFTTVSDSGDHFVVNVLDVSYGNYIILALYNSDGVLVEMQSAKYTGAPLSFTTDKNYATANVMVWKDINNMLPIGNVEYVK